LIQYFTELNQEEQTCIVISHVRKGSLAYRTGILHIGDKLLALNGNKMSCVEDAITFIDAIPLGEIVSVTVQKEQEVEGKLFQPASTLHKFVYML
jgi:S1-C subfamily serine protease